jgi:hypothetical protein
MVLIMNKQRRKDIGVQISNLENIKSNLEAILSDEECYFDNMPENLQGSIRGEDSENAIDNLSEAIDSLDEIINSLQEI